MNKTHNKRLNITIISLTLIFIVLCIILIISLTNWIHIDTQTSNSNHTEIIDNSPKTNIPEKTIEPDVSPSPVSPDSTNEQSSITISSDILDTELSFNDANKQVELLQSVLSTWGFNVGKIDGVYGYRTQNAVKIFQSYSNIDPSGIVDNTTLLAINKLYAEKEEQALERNILPLEGVVIGLDPGHQQHGNSDKEPIAPESTTLKAKCSTGTCSRFIKDYYEYELNLAIGLMLRDALIASGCEVIMTRDKHDVDISNIERATMMNNANVDSVLRIHANGSENSNISGMFFVVPSLDSLDGSLQKESDELANELLQFALESTGAKDRGIMYSNKMTGFNWSTVPVCMIEMGHMTNREEDALMATEEYRKKIVIGLVNGFINYYSENKPIDATCNPES